MTKNKLIITYNHNSRILRRAFDPGFLDGQCEDMIQGIFKVSTLLYIYVLYLFTSPVPLSAKLAIFVILWCENG